MTLIKILIFYQILKTGFLEIFTKLEISCISRTEILLIVFNFGGLLAVFWPQNFNFSSLTCQLQIMRNLGLP